MHIFGKKAVESPTQRCGIRPRTPVGFRKLEGPISDLCFATFA